MKVQSFDIDNVGELQQEATLGVFQSVLKSLPVNVQVIYKKTPMDNQAFKNNIVDRIRKNTTESLHDYGIKYLDYLHEVSKDKLDKVAYLIVRTESKCSYIEAESYLRASFETIKETFGSINIDVKWVKGIELAQLYSVPSFIKEELDYVVYGEEYRRTYVIMDYPRFGFPNWLRPLLNFKYPIEFSQHFHPFPKDKVIHQLEVTSAKMASTMNMQEDLGNRPSSELDIRKKDLEKLIESLASGEDAILEVSFYVTLSAKTLEDLNIYSKELESSMKMLGLVYRTSRKQMKKAMVSTMPVCDNQMLESYTFDTKSLSTLLPFTVQDYYSKNGILYGLSLDGTELISFNRHAMPNSNTIVLGATGYGKSMFAKVTSSREMVNGAQGIIIDHKGEWRAYCELMGGQYVTEEDEAISWECPLIVFGYQSKAEALRLIWNKVTSTEMRMRFLVIEEFHNILVEDKELMLQVIREIRKYFVAPTLITQNVQEFLRSDEGKMIMDNCEIKVLMHQGENDLREVEKLFNFSQSEKIYLQTCPIGRGYLYTSSFKTRFKVDYSIEEEKVLTTNPLNKIGGK